MKKEIYIIGLYGQIKGKTYNFGDILDDDVLEDFNKELNGDLLTHNVLIKKENNVNMPLFKYFEKEIELENGKKITSLIYPNPFIKYQIPTINKVNYQIVTTFKMEVLKNNNLKIGSKFIYNNETYKITSFVYEDYNHKSCKIVKVKTK